MVFQDGNVDFSFSYCFFFFLLPFSTKVGRNLMLSDLLQLTEGPAPSVLYNSVRKNSMFTDDCHQKRTASVNQAM